MNNLIIIVTMAAVAHSLIPQQSFDVLDVDEYKDKGRLAEFIKCVGFQGCCTWQELIIRDRAPHIVGTNCSDCTKEEKKIVAQLTVLIAELNTTDLKSLMNVYDPSTTKSRGYFNDLNQVNEESGLPEIPEDVIKEYPDFNKTDDIGCFND